MVGLVVVSHSAALAEGVLELAAQMAGPNVRMCAAGGLDEPGALGTDAGRVLRAIEEVWSEDGVLVLMDLGSAVMSAELALELLGDERRACVRLTAAPLVEGAVAAAVAASLGDPLDAVAAAGEAGLAAKATHLEGEDGPPAEAAHPEGSGTRTGGKPQTMRVPVRNRLGLHARPAALLVRTAGGFDARVQVTNVTNGRGPANARSLAGVATLGARQGDELLVTAEGRQAEEALAAIRRLADEGFGEPVDMKATTPPVAGVAGKRVAGAAVVRAAGAAGEPDSTVAGERRPTIPPAASDSSASTSEQPEAPVIVPPVAGSVLTGLPAAPGTAIGAAKHIERRTLSAADGILGDPDVEWSALQRALAETATDVRQAKASMSARAGAQEAAIFDAHLLMLEDEALLEPARRAIAQEESATRAWRDAVNAEAAEWERLEDPYQRARAADLRAVGDQVLAHLAPIVEATDVVAAKSAGEMGAAGAAGAVGSAGVAVGPSTAAGLGASTSSAEERVILIAPDLTPAEVSSLDPSVVAGIACASGGPTSHAVILARALGLPAVVGAGPELLGVADGTPLVVDGDAGTISVNPTTAVRDAAERRRRQLSTEATAAQNAALEPAVTSDGVAVRVEANIAGPQDVACALAAGADGVGLLRTEFLFLHAAALPDEDEQAAAYDAVAAALDGRPLTVRTLDAGADKPLASVHLAPEDNPFLGIRGLRLSLQHPEQLRCQLRALLRVAASRPLRVMLPMVSTVEELRRARELLEEARTSLDERAARVPARLPLGIMVEVPSAALVAGHLAPLVDFFSVGTNDLTQYVLAAERGNAAVAALADPLHPAVLRLIDQTAQAAAAAGRPLAVCGEVAGDRHVVPLLLGLGVNELSMSPALIPAAKQAVRTTDTVAARDLAARALEEESAAGVRRLLATAGANH